MFVFIVSLFTLIGAVYTNTPDVRNLIGEPDYRSVRLHWEVDPKTVNFTTNAFQVRFCELQTWGAQRCRTQPVADAEGNDIDSGEVKEYVTNVKGLRMATTYSFEIKASKEPGKREDRAEGDDKNQNIIVIPTKGFSARATQCLPHASEIEVSTGPYFGGRIAVEAADGERCALDGDPKSSRDMYILRINHTECGSQVNETTVATFVLVQENLPILTHSTRRFLVLCSYQPETLTVRAGINLPTQHAHGHASISYEEDSTNYNRRSRQMRTGRLVTKPEALVTEERYEEKEQQVNPLPIVLIAVFMVGAISMFVLVAVRWNIRKMARDMDNVSIASDVSVSTNACSEPDVAFNSLTSSSSRIYHV